MLKPSKKLRIDVWSDIACPWCYVGKRRLEAALAAFPHASEVEVVWRAFELDPSSPRERDSEGSYAERLARKYRTTTREADSMIARMTDVAREDGLDFRFDRIRPGNTFDAHRLLHLAGERGMQDAVKERLLFGYMTEGAPIGDPETLAALAVEAGLDPEDTRKTLTSDAYASDVREDENQAAELGIHGVPFFVLGGVYAISGAQPAELLLGALNKAWKDAAAEPEPFAEGEVCSPDGGCV